MSNIHLHFIVTCVPIRSLKLNLMVTDVHHVFDIPIATHDKVLFFPTVRRRSVIEIIFHIKSNVQNLQRGTYSLARFIYVKMYF